MGAALKIAPRRAPVRALPAPDLITPEILARWPAAPPKTRPARFAATRSALYVLAGWLTLAAVILMVGAGAVVIGHAALKAALEVAAVVEGQP